jgi:hypothetical protein
MDEIQTPGAEAEVPATAAVEAPNAIAPAVTTSGSTVGAAPSAEVPNVSAPTAVVSEQPVGVVAAVGADIAEVPSILKSELAHVFEAFEHFSLMEGISRLYALAKRVL